MMHLKRFDQSFGFLYCGGIYKFCVPFFAKQNIQVPCYRVRVPNSFEETCLKMLRINLLKHWQQQMCTGQMLHLNTFSPQNVHFSITEFFLQSAHYPKVKNSPMNCLHHPTSVFPREIPIHRSQNGNFLPFIMTYS